MDVVTLALAKKFAKNYTDSHSVTITPEFENHIPKQKI